MLEHPGPAFPRQVSDVLSSIFLSPGRFAADRLPIVVPLNTPRGNRLSWDHGLLGFGLIIYMFAFSDLLLLFLCI